jgi:hypothetical protein
MRGTSSILLRELLGHFATGLQLGIFCALTLLIMDAAELRSMLGGLQSPRIAIAAFVAGMSAVCAVGATLTGFLFTMAEKSGAR